MSRGWNEVAINFFFFATKVLDNTRFVLGVCFSYEFWKWLGWGGNAEKWAMHCF